MVIKGWNNVNFNNLFVKKYIFKKKPIGLYTIDMNIEDMPESKIEDKKITRIEKKLFEK